MNWPSVANGDPLTTAWDTHASRYSVPFVTCIVLTDSGLSSLLRMDEGGVAEGNTGVGNRGIAWPTAATSGGRFHGCDRDDYYMRDQWRGVRFGPAAGITLQQSEFTVQLQPSFTAWNQNPASNTTGSQFTCQLLRRL